VLREWDEGDLPAMVELFDDPEVARFTPLPSPFTLGDARERLARARQDDRLLLAVTTDGERPRGEVLLTATGELGYAIGADHRGRGLAARALALLRDHAHEALGMPVLRLRIEPGNAASAATARRAGFRPSDAPEEPIENKGRSTTIRTWEHM
jgi:RimJ/RimL family protein N-acetyltransferase